jgi:hypothetical protein
MSYAGFRATTNERIARLRATRLRKGLAMRQESVSAAPAEWGTQQKCFFVRISKPAILNGEAYSSSVGV